MAASGAPEHGSGNYTLRSEHYRYIRYVYGSEESYDHACAPNEWHNLIDKPELADIINRHRAHKPASRHPLTGAGSTGHSCQASGMLLEIPPEH